MECRPSLLDKILTPGEVRTVYQPIARIKEDKAEILGIEALTRGPKGTNLERADVFFEYVRRKRKEHIVDLTCVNAAIRSAVALPNFGKLFLNVHASTLAKNQDFVDGLECTCSRFAFSPRELVIEVVEHSPYWDRGEFVLSTRRLRGMGVQIAVDDLGVAYSSFKVILDVNPDFLKIDMYIIRGCSRDRVRLSMIESFVLLGQHLGADLIAEGIESPEDLEVLQELGLTLFQGYLIAVPQSLEQLVNISTEYGWLLRNVRSNLASPDKRYPEAFSSPSYDVRSDAV